MMLFLRLFLGCILQLLPFSVLCLYPFQGHFRVSNRSAFLKTTVLILFLGFFFAHSCIFFSDRIISPEHRCLFSNIVFMLCLIPCLIWYLFLVKDIWQKKLFIFLFVTISAMTMTSLINTIMTSVASNGNRTDFPYEGYTNLILFIFTALILPFFLILLKKGFMPVADFLSKKEYIILCIFSLILFVVLGISLVLIPAEYSYIGDPFSVILYVTLMFSVSLIYFMIFYIFQISKNRIQAEYDLQQYQMQIQIQAEQYRQLMNQIAETKRLRHDYRHHLLTLKSFLTAGETERLRDYLNEHLQHTEDIIIEKYCENEGINYLISHYMSLCREHDIILRPSICYPSTLTLSTAELSVLLGNLLENAYTAALHAPQEFRFININIMVRGQLLVITTDNGFDGMINEKNGIIESTKLDHTGLGIESIKNIVEKHNGNAEFLYESNTFHTNIIMRGE